MKEQWLAAVNQMTYGIYVLTVRCEKTINGRIASWVTQVSYDPPLIMAAVHPNRYSHDLIEQGRSVAPWTTRGCTREKIKKDCRCAHEF